MSAETDSGAEQGPPVDLAAVAADDALLDVLTSSAPRVDSPRTDTDPLPALLVAWRAELGARPIPAVSPADDHAMIAAVACRAAHRRRWPAPVGAAAAVLVVVLAGAGAVVHQARPGDALWGVSQVVFSDQARSVEAAAGMDADLTRAQQALAQGRTADADAALQAAAASLAGVAERQGAQPLRDRLDALTRSRAAAGGPGSGAAAPTSTPAVAPAPQLPTSAPGGPGVAITPVPGPAGPPRSTVASPSTAPSPSLAPSSTPSNTAEQSVPRPSTGPELSRNATSTPPGSAAPTSPTR